VCMLGKDNFNVTIIQLNFNSNINGNFNYNGVDNNNFQILKI
jgi:hypothetical protein